MWTQRVPRAAAGTTVLAAALAIVAALAPAARSVSDEGMCLPPTEDTTGWRYVKAQGISVRVPPNFKTERRRGNWVYLEAGHRQIGLGLGEGLDEVTGAGVPELVDGCRTEIGGRPVEIRVLQFSVIDAPLAPSGNAGIKYIADARWTSFDSLPTVSAFIYSDNRSDLHRWKWVFYSADVGVKARPPCETLRPMPPADSIVDSAAIAMRMSADAKRWPAGAAVIVLRFNSDGALASMGVTAGDLPDSTKHALAMLVGTNVRERPAGAASAVQLKVMTATDALRYEVMTALSCPP